MPTLKLEYALRSCEVQQAATIRRQTPISRQIIASVHGFYYPGVVDCPSRSRLSKHLTRFIAVHAQGIHHMKSRILLGCLAVSLLAAGAGWMKLFVGSGAEMAANAQKFLASLTPAQQAQATVKFDDPARLKWHFIPLAQRKGLQIK